MGASLLNALGQMCASGRMELDEYQKHVEALSQRQNYLEAANCAMAKAAALAPDDANVAFLAGIAAEDGGLREDAIRHFERALMLRPDWEEVELRLGGLLIEDAK